MQLTNKYLTDKETLKRNCRIIGILILATICAFIVAINLPKKTSIIPSEKEPTSEEGKNDGNENPTTGNDKKPETPKKEPSFPNPVESHLVTRVSDGDTMYVEGYSVRARLIGIDTPEVYNTDTAVYKCYGPEASEYVKNLLLGKRVGIETDADTGRVDSHGRPLIYIYYEGKNINYELIRLGYARENDYGGTYKYKEEFTAAQEEAKQNQRGLWSPNTCNGN